MAELRRKTEEWGLLSRKNKPLGLQTVAGILNNPFYCGLMRIKGHHYPHSYPRLVDHAVFSQCEKRKRNPKQAIKITRYPFVLRGLLTCAVSGRKVTGLWKESRETSFYLSNRPIDAAQAADAIRKHWGIENRSHYIRDVTFREDASRIRTNPGIFARLRSFAYNILRFNKQRTIAQDRYAAALGGFDALASMRLCQQN